MLVNRLGWGGGAVAVRVDSLLFLGIVLLCSKMLALALCAPSTLSPISPNCRSPVLRALSQREMGPRPLPTEAVTHATAPSFSSLRP